jgi:RHS repeat-associated protein
VWRSSERGVRPEPKSPEGREPVLRCAGLGSRICFALALAGYFDLDELDGSGPESSGGTAPAIPVARRIAANTDVGVSTLSSDPRRYSLYSPEMNLLAETEHTTSATPPIQYEYVWFAGAPVAQFTYGVPSEPLAATEVVWTVTDHLGTPKLQTGATGAIVWHAEHEPYGRIYVLRAGEGRHQPLRFPGQEAEQLGVNAQNGVSDRSYNIARWYRGSTGRYTQIDPLRERGEPNPYAYARLNPLSFSDPYGLKARTCCKSIAGGPLSPFKHCYVEVIDDDSGERTSWGFKRPNLFVSIFGFGLGKGTVEKDYFFDQGGDCPDWTTDCGTDDCVEKAVNAYPSPSTYWILGPNSNTFAATITNSCGLNAPHYAGSWHTPGWNSEQPLP